MASSKRVKQDASGLTMVPMNIDAQYDTTSFMNLPKAITLGLVVLTYLIVILWGKSNGFNFLGWVVVLGFVTFVSQFVIRKIVFQERYFFKQWKEKLKLGIPKVTHFWNIAYTQKTALGDALMYSDLRLGVVIELEKDTIVGTSESNKEEHLDAWSGFYNCLFKNKLGMVQMNLMQPTGKDDRFDTVADEIRGAENPNIRKLLELSLGHMKTISNSTLDEHEYILIYSKSVNKAEDLIKKALEATEFLLSGSYRGARILNEAGTFRLPRWNFNVMYFDGVQAQLGVYQNSGMVIGKPVAISEILFDTGESVELTPVQRQRLESACKLLDSKEISYLDWDVQKALDGDFEGVGTVTRTITVVQQTKESKKPKRIKLFNKKNKATEEVDEQEDDAE